METVLQHALHRAQQKIAICTCGSLTGCPQSLVAENAAAAAVRSFTATFSPAVQSDAPRTHVSHLPHDSVAATQTQAPQRVPDTCASSSCQAGRTSRTSVVSAYLPTDRRNTTEAAGLRLMSMKSVKPVARPSQVASQGRLVLTQAFIGSTAEKEARLPCDAVVPTASPPMNARETDLDCDDDGEVQADASSDVDEDEEDIIGTSDEQVEKEPMAEHERTYSLDDLTGLDSDDENGSSVDGDEHKRRHSAATATPGECSRRPRLGRDAGSQLPQSLDREDLASVLVQAAAADSAILPFLSVIDVVNTVLAPPQRRNPTTCPKLLS